MAVSKGKEPPRPKLKVDRWREENPDYFKTWETKYGCVVQFWGVRVYYGRCKEDGCTGLVTARRSIQGEGHRFKSGQTQLGRWPSLCGECRERKQNESYTKNRKYAANYRRGMYERRGFGPRQGIPGVGATMRRMERQDREDDHWHLYHFADEGETCDDPKCVFNKPD